MKNFRLEPLVQRIKEKRSAILCPMIDAINEHTMEYPPYVGGVMVGGFTWSLFFTWDPLPERDKPPDWTYPVRSVVFSKGGTRLFP